MPECFIFLIPDYNKFKIQQPKKTATETSATDKNSSTTVGIVTGVILAIVVTVLMVVAVLVVSIVFIPKFLNSNVNKGVVARKLFTKLAILY